jgi:K+-sensing histidine kinase KdpD
VPVIIGVVVGGFRAGVLSVIDGFLVYDFFFIPPYQTLWVGEAQNWVRVRGGGACRSPRWWPG